MFDTKGNGRILLKYSLIMVLFRITYQTNSKDEDLVIDCEESVNFEDNSSDYLSRWVDKCFGILYCKNHKMEKHGSDESDRKDVNEMKKIGELFCGKILSEENMDKALKSVEFNALKMVKKLNGSTETRENIKKFTGKLVKNQKIGEKMPKLLATFEYNSFSDVLNDIYQIFANQAKVDRLIHLAPKNKRRKKRDPENGLAQSVAEHGRWTAKCHGYLVGLIVALVGIAVPCYELLRLSDNFVTINAILLLSLIISIVGLFSFLILLMRHC